MRVISREVITFFLSQFQLLFSECLNWGLLAKIIPGRAVETVAKSSQISM